MFQNQKWLTESLSDNATYWAVHRSPLSGQLKIYRGRRVEGARTFFNTSLQVTFSFNGIPQHLRFFQHLRLKYFKQEHVFVAKHPFTSHLLNSLGQCHSLNCRRVFGLESIWVLSIFWYKMVGLRGAESFSTISLSWFRSSNRACRR